ncbi:Hypothetical predicted protein [Podarcis lilfordi]|uniref:Uncharacterized protein n=1 Tax=Podarcis lilfordi TaxID=74358 RepID=A0AA35P7C8_9SAUR|nr:Hypothetical predicted protein [Podarcis lilfordi]
MAAYIGYLFTLPNGLTLLGALLMLRRMKTTTTRGSASSRTLRVNDARLAYTASGYALWSDVTSRTRAASNAHADGTTSHTDALSTPGGSGETRQRVTRHGSNRHPDCGRHIAHHHALNILTTPRKKTAQFFRAPSTGIAIQRWRRCANSAMTPGAGQTTTVTQTVPEGELVVI